MEAKESLSVRLKPKISSAIPGFAPDSETSVFVTGMRERGGSRMLVIEREVEGPQSRMIVEINIASYFVLGVVYTGENGDVFAEEYDDSLLEQGEAVETIQEYLDNMEDSGEGIAGPARIEITFRYSASNVLGSPLNHKGVVTSCRAPEENFNYTSVTCRAWDMAGRLSRTTNVLNQGYVSIISIRGYTAQETKPFLQKSFRGDDAKKASFEETIRLFKALTSAEQKLVEHWECTTIIIPPRGSSTPNWERGRVHPPYNGSYSAYGSYPPPPPKPAVYREAGDPAGLALFQAIQKAIQEGKALMSLQEAEEDAGVVEEKKYHQPGVSNLRVLTFCDCNSPKCAECSPNHNNYF